jgi:lactoylglutathione lyase
MNNNNMTIDHIAIWVDDIETMRQFYSTYFDAISSEIYRNPGKNYTSYFLSFGENKTRIELIHRPDVMDSPSPRNFTKGLTHLAISVGNVASVNELTERLRTDGYTVQSEPRTTGDGYYESVVSDPERNSIEITANK